MLSTVLGAKNTNNYAPDPALKEHTINEEK